MSLRDQFKKANLISDKDHRRLAHEARVERKEKGHEQIENEQQHKLQDLAQLQERERLRIQQQQRELEQQRALREEEAAVDAILEKAAKAGPGAVRFYFETVDSSLPCLEVSPREAQEIRAGQLCIVTRSRVGAHDYRLLSLELTRRVARLRREAVVHAPPGILN